MTTPGRWPWRRRTAAIGGLALAVAGLWAAGRQLAAGPEVETAEVVRGDFVDLVTLRGEVKAHRSVVIAAPSGAGDLQIVEVAANGAEVKAGDVVARFDPTTLERTLAEKRSALRQAEAEIAQAQAQARLLEEAALTERTRAQYDVQRAQLDVGTREVISRLDAEKAAIKLTDAEQKVREIEARLAATRAAARAEVAGLEQKRDKARADVARDERSLGALTVRAPVDGLVVLGRNWRAGPFGGREWRAGDRAWAGAVLGELPELATPYVAVKIDEIDRVRLRPDMEATITVEALPGVELPARLASFSTLARLDLSTWPPPRLFDVTVKLTRGDARLRPGMTASVRVPVSKLPRALLVPARAVMQVAGVPSVYVLATRGPGGLGRRVFEPRTVEVARRGQDQVALSGGVREGERVALENPTRATPEKGR